MADLHQQKLLYHFCRLRLPAVALPLESFCRQLERVYHKVAAGRNGTTWAKFLENLHTLDWFLACACLEGLPRAWETLFNTRATRTDSLLVDALRSRALRLFPRDPEQQEEAVTDFWGYLLAGQREGTEPILARYDGQRPLVPWLICVFQNKVLSQLRKQRGEISLPEEDIGFAATDDALAEHSDVRWREHFRDAAREWLSGLNEQQVLLLGLRIRYKLSQREVAKLLGINEGNVTRRVDALSKSCHERIGQVLRELGWTGDDLYDFIRTEMFSLLLEEPSLSVARLAAILAARGQTLPETSSFQQQGE